MYKKCKLVMLPSKEKAIKQGDVMMKIKSIVNSGNELALNSLKLAQIYYSSDLSEFWLTQYLYILSDDDIKEGDWCIRLDDKLIFHALSKVDDRKGEFKIIATTDESLKIGQITDGKFDEHNRGLNYLPQLPKSFIDHYITEYNKDNIITNVFVEYQGIYEPLKFNSYEDSIKAGHNIDLPKLFENTITIDKVKDTWTRDEVISLIELAAANYIDITVDSDKWINENL